MIMTSTTTTDTHAELGTDLN